MKKFALRLPDELVEQMRTYSHERKLGLSEAGRLLIERGLQRIHLDIEDPAALLQSVHRVMQDLLEKQQQIERQLEALDTNQLQATNAATESLEAVEALLTMTERQQNYDQEQIEMIAQLSIIGRMFVKSRFPEVFPELRQATSRQMTIVDRCARERSGRIEKSATPQSKS